MINHSIDTSVEQLSRETISKLANFEIVTTSWFSFFCHSCCVEKVNRNRLIPSFSLHKMQNSLLTTFFVSSIEQFIYEIASEVSFRIKWYGIQNSHLVRAVFSMKFCWLCFSNARQCLKQLPTCIAGFLEQVLYIGVDTIYIFQSPPPFCTFLYSFLKSNIIECRYN